MSIHSDTYKHLLDENPQEPGGDVLSLLPTSKTSTSHLCNTKCIRKYLPRIIASILAIALVGCAFGLFPYIAISSAMDNNYVHFFYFAAGAFVLITVPISAYGIMQHLVNYYMPQVQKVRLNSWCFEGLDMPRAHFCAKLIVCCQDIIHGTNLFNRGLVFFIFSRSI